jgi:hypothetical protein
MFAPLNRGSSISHDDSMRRRSSESGQEMQLQAGINDALEVRIHENAESLFDEVNVDVGQPRTIENVDIILNEDIQNGSTYATSRYDECCNCKRSVAQGIAHNDFHTYYAVHLNTMEITSSAFRRKFSNMKASSDEVEGTEEPDVKRVLLCQLCGTYLSSNTSKNLIDIVWPSMLWSILTNVEVLKAHGRNIWCYVPSLWRQWWVNSFNRMLGEQRLPVVSLEIPKPVLADVTVRKYELEEAIANGKLSRIELAVDKHLYPIVKCPWGCTEFFHKSGTLQFDLVHVCKIFCL